MIGRRRQVQDGVRQVDRKSAALKDAGAKALEGVESREREGGKDHEKKGHESKEEQCSVHSRRPRGMNRQK